MKRVLFCLTALLFPITGNAGSYTFIGDASYMDGKTNLPEDIRKAWGAPNVDPNYIQDTVDINISGFAIKNGYVCCGTTDLDKTSSTYGLPVFDSGYAGNDGTEGDKGFIAMLAQKDISEHGAKFCLTQVHANSTDAFLIEYQQPNWPGLKCAWFCEPGWDGIDCKEKTSDNQSCNPVSSYVAEIEKVKASIYGPGNDAIKLRHGRMGVADTVAIFDSEKINNFYSHEIVLGVIEFKEHGIVATPVVLGAVGDKGRARVSYTKAISGMKKTLCAQGYTNGENCNVSSKQCGSEILCSGLEDKYDRTIHDKIPNGLCSVLVCKDGDKGLDDNFKCNSCEQGFQQGSCKAVGDNMGKCIKCAIGKYFDETDCTCKDAKVLDKNQIKYGAFEGDIPAKQCWTMSNPKDFVKCMLGTDKS